MTSDRIRPVHQESNREITTQSIEPVIPQTVAVATNQSELVGYRALITEHLLSRSERFNSPRVYKINNTTVVKIGDSIHIQEVLTMQFVRKHTSVPVPVVLDSFVHGETSRN